jgi:uncharacterized protein YktA (UPF0223 family)
MQKVSHDTAVEVIAVFDKIEKTLERKIARKIGADKVPAYGNKIVTQADDQTLALTGYRIRDLFV